MLLLCRLSIQPSLHSSLVHPLTVYSLSLVNLFTPCSLVHTCIHCSCVHWFIHSLSFVSLFTVHSFMLICLFIHSFYQPTNPFIHSFGSLASYLMGVSLSQILAPCKSSGSWPQSCCALRRRGSPSSPCGPASPLGLALLRGRPHRQHPVPSHFPALMPLPVTGPVSGFPHQFPGCGVSCSLSSGLQPGPGPCEIPEGGDTQPCAQKCSVAQGTRAAHKALQGGAPPRRSGRARGSHSPEEALGWAGSECSPHSCTAT